LHFALKSIRTACARDCTAERASTWARIAWEWGARSESIKALQQLFVILRDNRSLLKERFWPAELRFSGADPSVPPVDWFWIAAAEQYERTAIFHPSLVARHSFFRGCANRNLPMPKCCGVRLSLLQGSDDDHGSRIAFASLRPTT
jgi:hypothetical protein